MKQVLELRNQKQSGASAEFSRILRQGRIHLILIFLFSVFVNILMLTGPLFMMQVYDRVLGSRSQETLGALVILIVILFALMGLLDFARGRIASRFGAKFQAELDGVVFDATIAHAIPPQNRALAATGLRELETVQSFCASPVLLAIMDIPWTPIFIFGLFMFSPLLGWFSVCGGVLLIIIAVISQYITHRHLTTAEVSSNQATSLADQSRRAAELIRSQGMTPAMSGRWQEMRRKALHERIGATDRLGAFAALTKTFRMFLQSAVLAVGAWLVLREELSGGAMIAGSILLGRALAPIEQCIGNWRQIERASSAWKSLKSFVDNATTDVPKTDLPAPRALLTVKNIYVCPPGSKAQTIKNVSFQITPGTALGIIGSSGSGKTTLAKAMLGLWAPISGEIRLDGAELTHYDRTVLGHMIGYLPQDVVLFSGTIAENIARMSRTPDPQKVVEAAKKANAHELVLSLPDGYDTVIAGGDSVLSGGQKQRIALARALYNDPVIVILDEPNSALDSEGSNALNLAVRGLKEEGKAAVIMTHRPNAISECNTLLVVQNGQATAFGPRDEVLKSVLQNSDTITRQLKPVGTSS